MFEYHISYSNGIFYAFAFDELKNPAGRFKSPLLSEVFTWIAKREDIDIAYKGTFVTESWSSI